MKKIFTIIILYISIGCASAQTREWSSPYVGYANTDMLRVDKVEFTTNKTVMYVTALGKEGSHFWVAPTSCLKSNGKRYALKEVPMVGINKQFTIPDSGAVHFTMQFDPLPANTKLMHFMESEMDEEKGWKLCNIRNGKDGLMAEVSEEWQNVKYENVNELPESKLCDDSTTVRVRILGYTPEAGHTLTLIGVPIDFDNNDFKRVFRIADDGTVTIRLHPCFPTTVCMQLTGGTYYPLLVVPGKEAEILVDMVQGGTKPVVAFKGALAKVNYELNVIGGKDIVSYDSSTTFLDSLIATKKKDTEIVSHMIFNNIFKFDRTQYCEATITWMEMDAERQLSDWLYKYNKHLIDKVKTDLMEKQCSLILDHPQLLDKVSKGLWIENNTAYHYQFPRSHSMTFIYQYLDAQRLVNFGGYHVIDDVYPYNKDIWYLHRALLNNAQDSYEYGLQYAVKHIQDPELLAYYTIAAKRWNHFVDSINSIPHIHFDTYGTVYNEAVKDSLMKDLRGKNVVFLIYDREQAQAIRELEELDPIIAKKTSKKTVFIHIDTNLMGAHGWFEFAQRWHGEHYGGRKTRYDDHDVFPQYTSRSTKILYELHAPDGKTTLTTTNIKEAIEAIKRLR